MIGRLMFGSSEAFAQLEMDRMTRILEAEAAEAHNYMIPVYRAPNERIRQERLRVIDKLVALGYWKLIREDDGNGEDCVYCYPLRWHFEENQHSWPTKSPIEVPE